MRNGQARFIRVAEERSGLRVHPHHIKWLPVDLDSFSDRIPSWKEGLGQLVVDHDYTGPSSVLHRGKVPAGQNIASIDLIPAGAHARDIHALQIEALEAHRPVAVVGDVHFSHRRQASDQLCLLDREPGHSPPGRHFI
jgi:hypothetical protein